jgi:hypothetical protein
MSLYELGTPKGTICENYSMETHFFRMGTDPNMLDSDMVFCFKDRPSITCSPCLDSIVSPHPFWNFVRLLDVQPTKMVAWLNRSRNDHGNDYCCPFSRSVLVSLSRV